MNTMSLDIVKDNLKADEKFVDDMNKKREEGGERIKSIEAEQEESVSFNAGLDREVFRNLVSEVGIEAATDIATFMAKNPEYSLIAARKAYETLHPDRSERKDTETER